jgi:hypothetical protein
MITENHLSGLIANPPTFTFATVPPKPAGYWVLYPGSAGKTKFATYLRPTDEQIKNTEALLGWGWEEA